MPSTTASCTLHTALPSTARRCANHQKNLASVESLTPTPPSELLKPSTGHTVRDQSESLSAINRNHRPHSPESALAESAACSRQMTVQIAQYYRAGSK